MKWSYVTKAQEATVRQSVHRRRYCRGWRKTAACMVPETLPRLDKSLEELAQMSYQETAYEVMKLF